MRKFTNLLLTAALLFGAVGGEKVFASKRYLGFKAGWYCNASWNSATNTFTWGTGSGLDASYVFIEALDVEGNDFSAYTSFHMNAKSFTNASAQELTVTFKSGDSNAGPTKSFTVSPDGNGDINIDLTAVADWGSCDITHIYDFTIWGCARDNEEISASVVITDAYLEGPDPEYREVYSLGSRISFTEALASSDPFVVVQNGKVLCGPLSPSDGSLTFKDVTEIEDYSWTIAFEEDAENAGSYFMHLFDKNDVSKGYINASIWSHTYLSNVDKSGTKGELQDGALWTVTETGTGTNKYTIRNLGVTEGNYNNKPGDGDGDRAAAGQGYLAITPNGYWKNHVTHYNTSGEWEFYTLSTTELPANDHLYFGWDDFTVDGGATSDDENHLVIDTRGYAPYWATSGTWKFGTPLDASGYRYLVFYAKRNITKYGNGDDETGGSLLIKDDNGVTMRQDDYDRYGDPAVDYPDVPSGSFWMNRWGAQRAMVLDLQWLANTDKYGDGSECEAIDITKIKEIGVAGTFTIGGIFFTNTMPAYSAGDYKRSFDSFEKFGTICLPYSAVCCGAQLYEIAGAFDGGISLVEHEGVMEAGKPYLYKSLEAIKQDGGFKDEDNVYFFKAGYETVKAPIANNGLIGTFSDITAPAGTDYLILSSNKLYNTAGSTVTVGANKAYIDKTAISDLGGAVKAFISFGDDATKINAVENEQLSLGDAEIYNLAGQRMSKLQRGINIVNGKKVLVK